MQSEFPVLFASFPQENCLVNRIRFPFTADLL
jgi:hypothetical protein